MKIKFLTGNAGKLKEATDILGKHDISVESIKMDLPEIQSLSVQEVISNKLDEAIKHMNHDLVLGKDEYLMVDDTGLEIDNFNDKNGKSGEKLPGALIKFFIKNMSSNKFLELAENSPAEAITFIGLLDNNGNKYFFCGKNKGHIKKGGEGQYGFGWDELFFPSYNPTKSLAQIPPEEKNTKSFRYIALKEVLHHLKHTRNNQNRHIQENRKHSKSSRKHSKSSRKHSRKHSRENKKHSKKRSNR